MTYSKCKRYKSPKTQGGNERGTTPMKGKKPSQEKKSVGEKTSRNHQLKDRFNTKILLKEEKWKVSDAYSKKYKKTRIRRIRMSSVRNAFFYKKESVGF